MRALVLILASLLILTAPASACDDDKLWVSKHVCICEDFTTCLKAPQDSMAFLILSGGPGPTPTQYGPLHLDFPFVFILPIPLQAGQTTCFDHYVHCDPLLVGIDVFMQYVALRLHDPSKFGVSNPVAIHVGPEDCGGGGGCGDDDDDDD